MLVVSVTVLVIIYRLTVSVTVTEVISRELPVLGVGAVTVTITVLPGRSTIEVKVSVVSDEG